MLLKHNLVSALGRIPLAPKGGNNRCVTIAFNIIILPESMHCTLHRKDYTALEKWKWSSFTHVLAVIVWLESTVETLFTQLEKNVCRFWIMISHQHPKHLGRQSVKYPIFGRERKNISRSWYGHLFSDLISDVAVHTDFTQTLLSLLVCAVAKIFLPREPGVMVTLIILPLPPQQPQAVYDHQ